MTCGGISLLFLSFSIGTSVPPVPVRPASPLPPGVPTGPRNQNKYKDRDGNAPAVDGLDYGKDFGGRTPSGEPEDRGSRYGIFTHLQVILYNLICSPGNEGPRQRWMTAVDQNDADGEESLLASVVFLYISYVMYWKCYFFFFCQPMFM